MSAHVAGAIPLTNQVRESQVAGFGLATTRDTGLLPPLRMSSQSVVRGNPAKDRLIETGRLLQVPGWDEATHNRTLVLGRRTDDTTIARQDFVEALEGALRQPEPHGGSGVVSLANGCRTIVSTKNIRVACTLKYDTASGSFYDPRYSPGTCLVNMRNSVNSTLAGMICPAALPEEPKCKLVQVKGTSFISGIVVTNFVPEGRVIWGFIEVLVVCIKTCWYGK